MFMCGVKKRLTFLISHLEDHLPHTTCWINCFFFQIVCILLSPLPNISWPFHHRIGNVEVGSQAISWVTGKFALEIQNETGQSLTEFCQENVQPSWKPPSSNNTWDNCTHGHNQMVNTEIRLITLFAAKDGEALSSQWKQDRELTMAQIMNSLLPNSDLNWRK